MAVFGKIDISLKIRIILPDAFGKAYFTSLVKKQGRENLEQQKKKKKKKNWDKKNKIRSFAVFLNFRLLNFVRKTFA